CSRRPHRYVVVSSNSASDCRCARCMGPTACSRQWSMWSLNRPAPRSTRRPPSWKTERVIVPSSETVTFLFTDIEGSTRLWQEHPATMPDALARHDAIARAAIADGGGRLFKHTGDGVCAAFADGSAALAAAVALQRALTGAVWGDSPQLRVRVALDSGAAYQRDADYFGATLNRTARVLAVGSGGQILATAASIALAPETETIDLGVHRLRDLGEPIRLYQLAGDGLARTFPPLRSLERFRHNL